MFPSSLPSAMLQVRLWSRTSSLLVRCRHRSLHSAPLLEELTERGFIQDVTRRPELEQALASKPQTVYTGVDPTASSLHIGHLVPLLGLVHFHLHGHNIIPLVCFSPFVVRGRLDVVRWQIGSATGRIGDPSGRSTERKQQNTEELDKNIAGLTRSMKRFFERAGEHAATRLESQIKKGDINVKSNIDWHEKLTMIDFLRVVGIHARVNTMMNRERYVACFISHQHGRLP